MIFYTSDTHFNHPRIIELCQRPFATVQEMNNVLIRRWNDTVGPLDTVWHLGDFAMGDQSKVDEILSNLHGTINLVWGNHDDRDRINPGWFNSVQDVVEIKDGDDIVFLSHYPHRSWDMSHHGSYHLYGHVHDQLLPVGRSMDVGVDAWLFRPTTLSRVKGALETAGTHGDLIGRKGDFTMLDGQHSR